MLKNQSLDHDWSKMTANGGLIHEDSHKVSNISDDKIDVSTDSGEHPDESRVTRDNEKNSLEKNVSPTTQATEDTTSKDLSTKTEPETQDIVDAATAEAIASAKAATGQLSLEELKGEPDNSNSSPSNTEEKPLISSEATNGILSKLNELKSGDENAFNGIEGGETPRVSLALLLEASAAAAAAEKNAENQGADAETLRRCARERAETDKYITEAIHRVQTTPRTERSVELRPVDRREKEVTGGWSRYEQIKNDPQLLGECRRLVRGTQGCGRECDAKFTNLADFAKHVDDAHEINFRPFLCPKEHCPWAIIGFHERSECTRHIRTKHYKAMYTCEFQGCTKVYNRSDAFRRHVRQAHANPGSRFNKLTHRSDESK